MEDVLTEENSNSDFSGIYVWTSEDGLNWESGDSRPPSPSPPSSTNMNTSNVTRYFFVESEPGSSSSGDSNERDFHERSVYSISSSTISTDDDEDGNDDHDDDGDDDNGSDNDLNSQDYSITSPPYSPEPSSRSSPGSPLRDNVPHSPAYYPQDPDSDVEIIEEGTANQQIPQEIRRIQLPPPSLQNELTSADVSQLQSTNSAVPKDDLNGSSYIEGEEASMCSICMDPLTNSGEHRVVCLRCGHIFGYSCVLRWIQVGCNTGARRCPTCNKKACRRDIRQLFLPKVVPLDTAERNRLIEEKKELLSKKELAEKKLSRCKYLCKVSAEQFKEKLMKWENLYEEAVQTIEQLSKGRKIAQPDMENTRENAVSKLLHAVELSEDGGCRVFTFNYSRQELIVSQPANNKIFGGYGIRVLSTVNFLPSRFIHLHQKMIRDLTFHSYDKNLLLSVSLDRSAKLVDLASSTTCHTFRVEDPLWSCCWDVVNPNLLLLGSQQGRVFQFDRRMLADYVNRWETPNNMTPVVSLASTPSVAGTAFPQGGFISCRLNNILAYARHGEKYSSQELDVEGPFMSMRFDYPSQTIYTASRPSSRSLYAQICLNRVGVDEQGNTCLAKIWSFNCGTTARVLSRMNTIRLDRVEDTIVIGHHESGRTINMWSFNSGNLLHSIPVRDPIIDMTGITLPDNPLLLATLSERRVCIYKLP